MRSLAVRLAVAIAVVGSNACGANTPTEPAPVYELKESVFTGTVEIAGKLPFMFTVVNPGTIRVSITALAPTSTIAMGVALGFWDAAATTCVEELSTNAATLNVALTATPSAPGDYCVAIYDSGNVQVPTEFTMRVTYY